MKSCSWLSLSVLVATTTAVAQSGIGSTLRPSQLHRLEPPPSDSLPRLNELQDIGIESAGLRRRSAAGSNTSIQKVALASYIAPTDSKGESWLRMIGYSNDNVGILVANVNNGPGTQVDGEWNRVLTNAAAKKKTVLGYVPTDWMGMGSSRSPGYLAPKDRFNQAIRDINAWYSLYPGKINGIFFDQGFSECIKDDVDVATSYQKLNEYAKTKHPGALTVLNPGNGVPECYANSSDILLTYEGSYENYTTSNIYYKALDWTPQDIRKIWHIVYRVPEQKIREVVEISKRNGAGFIQVTDRDDPNPYNKLPSRDYMTNFVHAVTGNQGRVEEDISSLIPQTTTISTAAAATIRTPSMTTTTASAVTIISAPSIAGWFQSNLPIVLPPALSSILPSLDNNNLTSTSNNINLPTLAFVPNTTAANQSANSTAAQHKSSGTRSQSRPYLLGTGLWIMSILWLLQM